MLRKRRWVRRYDGFVDRCIEPWLTLGAAAGNLFFQLVNARDERGAMILTSNRGFAEWGQVFGDPVIATALLDRLLHHAVVVHIEGSSYRMRQHADLLHLLVDSTGLKLHASGE